MGGYVQYGNVWGTKPEVYGDSGRTAELTFRIPAEQAEAFLTFAEGNGEVVRQSVNTEDVTLDYYDRETRLEVLRTQLDRSRASWWKPTTWRISSSWSRPFPTSPWRSSR